MTDPAPSFQDLFDIGKAEATHERPSLTFRDGDQTTAVLRAGAAMGDHVLGWFAGQIRSMLFNGAVGDELDAIIMDRTQIPRNSASAAYGSVSFARTGSGSAGVVSSGTQLSTEPDGTGATSTYLTDVDLPYPAGAFSLNVAATCALSGTAGNFAGGALNIVDDVGDASITASTSGMAGGNDAESDAHYLVRAVTHFLSERRATKAALEEGALTVPRVASAHAFEDKIGGVVKVRIANADGESTAEMEYRANVALEEWRAAGVYVAAQGMHASQLDLVISLDDYADGFDVEQASATIIESVTNRLKGGKPGQVFTLDEIRIAAGAPYATQIYKMSFAFSLDGVEQNPTADITPADGRSIRLSSLSVIDGKST